MIKGVWHDWFEYRCVSQLDLDLFRTKVRVHLFCSLRFAISLEHDDNWLATTLSLTLRAFSTSKFVPDKFVATLRHSPCLIQTDFRCSAAQRAFSPSPQPSPIKGEGAKSPQLCGSAHYSPFVLTSSGALSGWRLVSVWALASFNQTPDKASNAVKPQASTVGCPRVVREMGTHFPDSPSRRNRWRRLSLSQAIKPNNSDSATITHLPS